ncbi:Methionine aminopeptidase 1 [Rhodotorula mucilaginosa]|uniref:Methionine aminopeptidase n=1 Tax=Rhodotorula mucilaginosa TaxID=5537 RepID=A0A9P6VZK4_RHOMI|nr:Methionine aminopeptidase 1 [Rhodotorula mucilaginosa]
MSDPSTAAANALGASVAPPPPPKEDGTPQPVATGRMCTNGCGKQAGTLECPKCQALGVSGSFFCSQQCFASNYPKHHKKMHVPAPRPGYVFPEGTKDGFDGRFKYTGKLRSVMPIEPVPKREVPAHIPKPDYATESEALESIPARWSGVWGGRVFGTAEEVGRTIAYGLRDAANRMERQGRILNAAQIEGMRKVCRLAREVLDIAASHIRPGITTIEIDQIVHDECVKRDSYPSPLGYHKFPRSVCTSVNEVICHGIPDSRPLEDGDIINLDVTLFHGGFHGDINATYPVGPSVSQENLDLIACSRECLDEAIRMCKPGTQFQDVGKVIEEIASKRGFSTNKTYVGHGIHELFHAAPNVPHYAGNRASGTMRPGQTFTIEPMICVGHQKEVHWPDDWTAATPDGKYSAQFEETLLITPTGVEVLTAAPGWTLPTKPVVGNGSASSASASKNKKKKKKSAAAKAASAAKAALTGTSGSGEAQDGEADEKEEEAEESPAAAVAAEQS